jgi:crossover junction endodeoxyribonuclease RuvC
MIKHCVLGIDPGLSGAIAFYYPSFDLVSAEDMPIVCGDINCAELADRIMQIRPDLAVIEQVGARPGQGVSSMFKFGKVFGQIIGVTVALRIPTHFVTPQKWKKHFSLSSEKEKSRQRALQLWPDCAEHFSKKKHEGRAEAALIALYGAKVVAGSSADSATRQEEGAQAPSSITEGAA